MSQEGWTCAVVTSIEHFVNELIHHVGREQLRASMGKGVQLPLRKRPPTALELQVKDRSKKRARGEFVECAVGPDESARLKANLEKRIRTATVRLNKLEEADRSWAAGIMDSVDPDFCNGNTLAAMKQTPEWHQFSK